MPFGKYADFDACVVDQSKDHDVESAKAICGKMQAEMGGSNFVSQELDANGDLYLKYFFADSSITERPSAVGHFSLDKNALSMKDTEAVGLPFTILPRQDLSIKGDWHPWSPKDGATWDDHITFAKSYSPGHIVAITPESKLIGAGIESIKQNNGRFAIIKITDQRARDAFVGNPALIPKAVSPGFMNLETPNLDAIKNFKWVHLAAVPRGAYGDKATVYASCLGGNECINHLVGASVAQLDSQLRQSYCPIGASENIEKLGNIKTFNDSNFKIRNPDNTDSIRQTVGASQTISSLGDFSTDSKIMSDNANTVATPAVAPVSQTPPVAAQQTPTKGAPINTGIPTKGIIRLKDKNASVTPQGNQPTNAEPQGEDELTKLRSEVAKMQEIQAQAARREQIKKLIPKEPFIKKGKFDEKTFETEVDKQLAAGKSDQDITDHYNLLLERDNLLTLLTQSGLQLPNTNAPEGMQIPAVPTGGSYVTPSDVPGEPTGGSAADIGLKAVNELRKWWSRGL